MDIKGILDDFNQVADLAGVSLSKNNISLEILPAPHNPPSKIPSGKMAVYIFMLGEEILKVGKAGPKSQARYTYQHYNPKSSNNNLAKSLLNDIKNYNVNEHDVGDWIKRKTDRINILLDKNIGMPVLTLLESFLQCRLKPRFEGFKSQH